MGSYAEFWLDGFYIGLTKDDIDPSLMALFRSSDKKTITGKLHQLPIHSRHWMKNIPEDEEVDFVFYSAPVSVIRDRLDLLGYTFQAARLAFNRYLQGEIVEQEKMYDKFGYSSLPLEILRSIDVDSWSLALREIHDKGLSYPGDVKEDNDNKLIAYMLEHDWHGCPGPDLNVALRLAIEVLPKADECIYDVTDLVWTGRFEVDDDLVEYALSWDVANYYSRRIIVLTEGRSDSWILSESLSLLYPHLSDYFAFMDFDSSRVSGGVGNLANIVKAFSGAGIINKVIALFDNDTAAVAALRGLRHATIPKNIKIQSLPDIDLLNDYPTLGPSGLINMNVNGMAAGIELYLGEDVLQDSQGDYSPIQWTGYNSGVKKYQGEVLNKDRIQKQFKKKLEKCKADRKLIENTDWAEIQSILNILFTTFHNVDQEQILSWADEYYQSY